MSSSSSLRIMMFYSNTLFSALFVLQIASSTVHIPGILFDPCRNEEEGKFVKDRYDCHKFYYCASNEMAVSVDCPYGMIFNDEKKICDFALNYFCIPERKEGDDLVVSSTVAITTTLTPLHPVSQDGRCPIKDDGRLVFLPNNNECHRYYLCYHGHPIPQECIQELHWNQKLKRCDFPENAGCLVATSTLPSIAVTAVAAVGGTINCPFRGEQVFPHPEHCSYFIYCVNGYATVQQCPFFHHYDVQSRSCKWRTMAKCIANKE